jgi:hypothetical protein
VPRSLGPTGQNGLSFKIMGMGGSIVYGLESSDGNGFRLGLQNLLEDNGTEVTMSGTQWSGVRGSCIIWLSMADRNLVEHD